MIWLIRKQRLCKTGALAMFMAGVIASSAGDTQPAAAPQPVVTSIPPLGLCFIYDDPLWRDRAIQAGAGFNRRQFTWAEIEPTSGILNFATYDHAVSAERARGLEINGILMGTPAWAASAGVNDGRIPQAGQRPTATELTFLRQSGYQSASASPPRNLYLPWNHPDNYWGRFVYAIVSHYRGQVRFWEVWNEPDLSPWFWTGTKADYYQLLKVAYQAAKAADSSVTVLLAGLAFWPDPGYFEDILRLVIADATAPANHAYFDATPWHWYARPWDIYEKTVWVRSVLTRYGLSKPIWVNEAGVPVWNEPPGPGQPYPWSATTTEQAAFVIQAAAYARAADLGTLAIFRLHDADMSEAYGIARNDYTTRPAFTAYQVARRYLSQADTAFRSPIGAAERVVLMGSPNGRVSILWSRVPTATTVSFAAILTRALQVDALGQTTFLTPTNGLYTLTLPGATANTGGDAEDYIIGGMPVLIVEPDTTPPTSAVLPLPAVQTSTTFTVTWSGSDADSGIWYYDVEYRVNADPAWTRWYTATPQTAALFTGQGGNRYAFRVRARDRAGNLEAWPAGDGDTQTTIHLPTPTPTPTPVGMTTITLTLATGWTLIGLPITPTEVVRAEDLIQMINRQGGQAEQVVRWWAGGWEGHLAGLPVNNFSLRLGQGVFVYSRRAGAVVLHGLAPATAGEISLAAGWNLLTLPGAAGNWQASTLLGAINDAGGSAPEIARWQDGGWQSHLRGLPFNDFPIEPTRGYFLRMERAFIWRPTLREVGRRQ